MVNGLDEDEVARADLGADAAELDGFGSGEDEVCNLRLDGHEDGSVADGVDSVMVDFPEGGEWNGARAGIGWRDMEGPQEIEVRIFNPKTEFEPRIIRIDTDYEEVAGMPSKTRLSPHKDLDALGLPEGAGVRVRFFPAYSPDLNPIELMWSKVKALLRKTEARPPETLLLAIGDALSRVTQKNATDWFAHCGYVFI